MRLQVFLICYSFRQTSSYPNSQLFHQKSHQAIKQISRKVCKPIDPKGVQAN